MKSRDIIFFTLFRTDNPYSSISLSMSKELARNHRVFYVNHPYSLKDIVTDWKAGDVHLKRRLPKLITGRTGYETVDSIPHNFVAAQPPMTLPINWLPKGKLYDWFQKRNNEIILRSIRKIIKDYDIKDYVFFNCYDPFYAGYLPKDMGASVMFYQCIDDISQNAYTNKHGFDLELEACANTDIALVTSTNLYDLKAPHAKEIHTFFNAADFQIFEQVRTKTFAKPPELEGKQGKVVGFVGNLDELRIDYPLLKKCALAHPEKTFLMVGPLNNTEYKTLGLDTLPNMIFVGSKKLGDLPPYLQHMDCVLIPFLCNTLTKSIYPLKINEYLAAGKSVLSTSFSKDIRSFSAVITLAETHNDFVKGIDIALHKSSESEVLDRVAVANSNTWSARIAQLMDMVTAFEQKKEKVIEMP